ncbi:putative cetyltransferase [Microbacterium sp. TS-1]|uniref:GNAT family N-acetyltransferase n=1 Tax=Microbacterium sp. TS-1 TaxID=1344956 RepID=UPI00038FDAA7|nr:GNAT family N-acetyltransferase [Microbacterium sp. TS-1]GAD32901.1 putative cetyltransferase [Microbacterium sp. TS-1]
MSTRGPEEILETPRLILRRRESSDAAVFRKLWAERDPRVPSHRRIGENGHPTEADIAAEIRAAGEAPGPQLFTIVRRAPRDVIGYCGLVPADYGAADEPELAFELCRAAQGLGFATEAAATVIDRAATAGTERVWAAVWEWNGASRRVLEKLGFRHTDRIVGESAYGRSLLTVRVL